MRLLFGTIGTFQKIFDDKKCTLKRVKFTINTDLLMKTFIFRLTTMQEKINTRVREYGLLLIQKTNMVNRSVSLFLDLYRLSVQIEREITRATTI